MIHIPEDQELFQAKIKVVGVGGGGGNAVNNMVSMGIEGVEFLAANTDIQDLRKSSAHFKLKIGNSNRGLGAGGNPEKGKEAAMESLDDIKSAITGTDLVFITAGMGGGTGTGASPVIAKIAKEMGALTIAVVTKPFSMEGKPRMRNADLGLEELKKNVDALIVVQNDRLRGLVGKQTVRDAFKLADEVLYHAVKGISELITIPGYINIDFADVRAILQQTGLAMIGTGTAVGEGRAIDAAQKAVSNPLLEEISLHGSKGLLVNVTGGEDLTLDEASEAVNIITETAAEDVAVYFGMIIDPRMTEEIRVTVVATGFDGEAKRKDHHRGLRTVRPAKNIDEMTEDEYEIPAYIRRQVD